MSNKNKYEFHVTETTKNIFTWSGPTEEEAEDEVIKHLLDSVPDDSNTHFKITKIVEMKNEK